jgi:Reversibly glycosylated polypeptide
MSELAQIDVIVTTINDGSFLHKWNPVIKACGNENRVHLIVIPDKKTPAKIFSAVTDLQRDGISVTCPDLEQQEIFLSRLGEPLDFIPYNSDNRRNIGFLMSMCGDADMMISVDDDNFPVNGNYFREHEVVHRAPEKQFGLTSSTGWLNNCRMLNAHPAPIWPRGFPYFARKPAVLRETWETADVSINAGLWLGDPDIDAITRLGAAPCVTGLQGMSTVLAPGTWCPVNSQNTALRREVIPAYYFARMGHSINGYRINRLGDIFSGYFAEACAKHLGHTVQFGKPLVNQDRNDHDLLTDLENEFPAIRMLDQLLDWLPEAKLEGSTYRDTYESLSHGLDGIAETFNDSECGFLHRMAYHMRVWLKLCDQIGKE